MTPLNKKLTFLLLLLLVSQAVILPGIKPVRGDIFIDIEDPVDNDTSDVDTSPDLGSSSNFTAQQYGPDSDYDLLSEVYDGGLILDYVDVDTSVVDSSADKGSHSNFGNQKAVDSSYDTLTEANQGGSLSGNFGYETAGSNFLNQLEINEMIACRWYLPDDNVNIDNITVYGEIDPPWGSDVVTYGIYNESNSMPDRLIGYTVEGTWTTTPAWRTLAITSGGQNLQSGYYWLV